MSARYVLGGDRNIKSPDSLIKHLKDRLKNSEYQNKRLKELLIFNLDLIQQQNELITTKDKLYQRLRREHDSMKTKLNEHGINLVPPPQPSPPAMLSSEPTPARSTVKTEPIENPFNALKQLLLPEPASNPFSFDTEVSTIKTEETDPDVKPFVTGDQTAPSTDSSEANYLKMLCEEFKAVDDKLSPINKKAIKLEPSYLDASSTGNPFEDKLQKNKNKNVINALSLDSAQNMPKIKSEPSNVFEEYDYFGINKKNKLINSYSKSKIATTTCTVTSSTDTNTMSECAMFGSLSDKFQIKDTKPGDDLYQLDEVDKRAQSPIPKLTLQKTDQGHMKVMEQPSRRSNHNKIPESITTQEPDLDLVKTEPKIDWEINSHKIKSSLEVNTSSDTTKDFSLGDGSHNIPSNISMDFNEFEYLFTSASAMNLDNLDVPTTSGVNQKIGVERSKSTRTSEDSIDIKPLESQQPIVPIETNRTRKRKHSTATSGKGDKCGKSGRGGKGPAKRKPKKKATASSKKAPYPIMTTKTEYHTYTIDPDLSRYLNLDTEIKTDELNLDTDKKSAIEVPRWREKVYTPMETSEETENLDDKVFEKRHQKYEAEERRQLRWHMRRVREQRHLEKLKQRQPDAATATPTPPPVYTLWPPPQEIQYIEITDTLPVMAFGVGIPDLPPEDFMLPWVRASDALKKSKKPKTSH